MTYKSFVITVLSLFAIACSKQTENPWTNLGFSDVEQCEMTNLNIGGCILGSPEMISASDSSIVILDYYDGNLFSYISRGDTLKLQRFGTIGQGPGETLIGTIGFMDNSRFKIFYDKPFILGEFNVEKGDSLYKNLSFSKPENLDLSTLRCISDSILIALGNFDDKARFVTFNQSGEVIDTSGKLVGSDNPAFNFYHRFLANQGRMELSPDHSRCVAITNFSANIDFMDVTDGKINIVKSSHYQDPELQPIKVGKDLFQMLPTDETMIGFIDVTSNSSYVYALYAPHGIKDGNYSSPYIFVYDWEGTPVKVLEFEAPIYGVSATDKALYLITIDTNGAYNIAFSPL